MRKAAPTFSSKARTCSVRVMAAWALSAGLLSFEAGYACAADLAILDGSDAVRPAGPDDRGIGAGFVSVGYTISVQGQNHHDDDVHTPEAAPAMPYRPGDAIMDDSDAPLRPKGEPPYRMLVVNQGKTPATSSLMRDGVLIQTAWYRTGSGVLVVGTVWLGLPQSPQGLPFTTTVKRSRRAVTRIKLPGKAIMAVTLYEANPESDTDLAGETDPVKIGGTGASPAAGRREKPSGNTDPDMSGWHSDGIHHSLVRH